MQTITVGTKKIATCKTGYDFFSEPLNNSGSVVVKSFLDGTNFYAIISWQVC